MKHCVMKKKSKKILLVGWQVSFKMHNWTPQTEFQSITIPESLLKKVNVIDTLIYFRLQLTIALCLPFPQKHFCFFKAENVLTVLWRLISETACAINKY